ncbi:LamG domain-containing protein [Lutibacter citreus]|uniref:hypothetical protein n=1 Tax=Lutibacter citreus TaxID=2138210 RepID=UPI000DBE5BBA|nr:hypothetical protein [Lutibacter citreus]
MSIKIFLKVTSITAFVMVGFLSTAQELPLDLRGVYKTKPNSKLSDEFNGNRANKSFDTDKWHFRRSTKTGLGQGKEFVQEKDGKLICYGIKDKRKAGAIVSNNYFQYGWYVFKWRTTGIDENKRNAWHPSFWGSWDDTRKNWVPETSGKGDSWMEIDIMEFSTHSKVSTDWSSDSPAYIWVDSLSQRVKVNVKPGPSFGWNKAIMIDGKTDKYKGEVIGTKGHDKWQILGMEYNPDYLQMWKKDGEQWVKIGNKVTFTNNGEIPSLRTVPKKAVKPLYWYIGNLFMPHGKTEIQEDQITNSTLEVDWFHFYPLKKNSKH